MLPFAVNPNFGWILSRGSFICGSANINVSSLSLSPLLPLLSCTSLFCSRIDFFFSFLVSFLLTCWLLKQVSSRFAGCGAACCSGEGPFLTRVTCKQGDGIFYAGGFGSIVVRACVPLFLFLKSWVLFWNVRVACCSDRIFVLILSFPQIKKSMRIHLNSVTIFPLVKSLWLTMVCSLLPMTRPDSKSDCSVTWRALCAVVKDWWWSFMVLAPSSLKAVILPSLIPPPAANKCKWQANIEHNEWIKYPAFLHTQYVCIAGMIDVFFPCVCVCVFFWTQDFGLFGFLVFWFFWFFWLCIVLKGILFFHGFIWSDFALVLLLLLLLLLLLVMLFWSLILGWRAATRRNRAMDSPNPLCFLVAGPHPNCVVVSLHFSILIFCVCVCFELLLKYICYCSTQNPIYYFMGDNQFIYFFGLIVEQGKTKTNKQKK